MTFQFQVRKVHRHVYLLDSIRLGQAENFFGDETQDELRTHGCQPRNPRLTQIPLHVVFLGIAHAAMGEYGVFASVIAGFCGKVLRAVCFGRA